MSGNHNIRLIFHKTSKANIKLQQYTIMKNKLIGFLALIFFCISFQAHSDQLLTDDYIVQGSICVGLDCVNGENFNFDTIRMKENNVRIRFIDSSNSSSFPTRDWQLTANESTNGGLNKFSIDDIDNSTVPFTIVSGARNNAIYVASSGRIGFNTTAPTTQLHVLDGNSPTLRLDQDQSSGFSAQAWDVGGNETNFFIRDATNSSKIPFKIRPGASNNALYIDIDGDVGLETSTPDGQFDIAHYNDQNDHAFLVSPVSHVGINISNGHNPLGLFDVNTAAGKSGFLVQSDGKVGLGTGSTAVVGRFDVRSLDNTNYYFNVDDQGDIGIGTSAPTGRFSIRNTADNKTLLTVFDNGFVGLGTTTQNTYYGALATLEFKGQASTDVLFALDAATKDQTSSISFTVDSDRRWLLSSRHDDAFGTTATDDRFSFFNSSTTEVFTLHQNGSIFFGPPNSQLNNNTSHAIEHTSGAHLTTGGVWTDASSISYKENIEEIALQDALEALESLNPVTYNYKVQPEELYAGFIAEEVPDLVAMENRTSLAPMDIVAVLTKVVKHQQLKLREMERKLKRLEK